MSQDWLEPQNLDSPFRETTRLLDWILFPPTVSFLFDLTKEGYFCTEALELAGSATYLFDRRKAHKPIKLDYHLLLPILITKTYLSPRQAR